MEKNPLTMKWKDYFHGTPSTAPVKYKYPDAAICFNVQDFLLHTMQMDLEEAAIFNRSLFDAAMRGDWKYLRQFDFIVRIYKGTAKRASIAPSVRAKVKSVGKCAFCGSTERLSVDHIIPVSKDGSNDISNMQCLCLTCNVRKSNKLI